MFSFCFNKESDDDVELASLINLFQNVSFRGTETALANSNLLNFLFSVHNIILKLISDKPYNGSSLSEPKLEKLIENEILSLIQLSNRFLIKSYPAGSRIDSSNYDPSNYWNCGLQMGTNIFS